MAHPDGRETCGARNGTYVCQFEFTPGARHAGYHYAYFVSGDRARVAEWVDHMGQVTSRPAPPPVRVPRPY
jgi:hypothetical protein